MNAMSKYAVFGPAAFMWPMVFYENHYNCVYYTIFISMQKGRFCRLTAKLRKKSSKDFFGDKRGFAAFIVTQWGKVGEELLAFYRLGLCSVK